jgi:hypothetical protein
MAYYDDVMPFEGTLPPGVRDRVLDAAGGLPTDVEFGRRFDPLGQRIVDRFTPTPSAPIAPVVPSRPAPGGGYGGRGINYPGIPAYGGPGRPEYNFGPVPTFAPPEFQVPTYQQALETPGFQFRLGEGRKALEGSAAARGVHRTGGTLKDILQYGQKFASQEYQNVFDRALQGYDRRYRASRDV